ncbi:cytochrome P450 [Streptomyces sp. FH025]|uniref:cytochrome P450 n=1 Tax=Streptomyces sp. FH025 TaxID=2815937 RepID=UPI001A9EE6FA|nr:cytochrome P450 [Streptomyces sp. FH025]MBO1414202.1 cytochrome P450 [Streptomyces sp. FH025]
MTDTMPAAEAPQVLPYDPFDPAFHSNPYSTYERLREQGAVIPTGAGVAVLGYHEVNSVLRNPKLGRGDGAGVQDTLIPTPEGLERAVMFMDPPDHTRIRKLVNKAFTPRAVEQLRPAAALLADELMAEAARISAAEGQVDLTSTVFRPLGAGVLNILVGVPKKYLAQCIEYANDAGRGLDPAYTLSPDALANRLAARDGYVEIAQELLAERRKQPLEDLMSELVLAEEEGERLTETELLTTVANIFLAGFSAPQALMGLSALALLRHPDQAAWYREHPEHGAASIEELMRYDSAVQLINRTALEDTEVGGVKVKTGDEVFMLLGAANRDPKVYPDADKLDLARSTTVRQLGFGHGIHFCVAAPIAKLVAEIALNALVQYEVELVTEQPPTNGALAIRSLASLPVRIGARVAA